MVFDDEVMGQFIDNPILASCARKTNCRIYLTNRWLNRIIRPGCWERYFIINVSGEDQFAVDRCNRLVEKYIPAYRIRQHYKSKSKITLYTNEWIPDNSPVGECSMRIGAQRSNFGSLLINSPLANTRSRPISQTPWKISIKEKLGHYESPDIFRPIYCKAEYGPVEFINPRFALSSEITRLNFPNAFDRYTTFKAIDNENVNDRLQQQCCRFITAMRSSGGQKENLFFQNDFRQSTLYNFEKALKLCNEFSKKINSTDFRAADMNQLNKKEFFKCNASILNNSTRHESKKQVDFLDEFKNKESPVSQAKDKLDNDNTDRYFASLKSKHQDTDSDLKKLQSKSMNREINNDNVNQSNYMCPNSVEPNHNKKNDINEGKRNKNRKFKKKCNKSKRYKTISSHSFCRKKIFCYCLRSTYNRLMRMYLRRFKTVKSDSNLTLITSPIITDSINTTNKASKSLNVDDNTLDSLNSL